MPSVRPTQGLPEDPQLRRIASKKPQPHPMAPGVRTALHPQAAVKNEIHIAGRQAEIALMAVLFAAKLKKTDGFEHLHNFELKDHHDADHIDDLLDNFYNGVDSAVGKIELVTGNPKAASKAHNIGVQLAKGQNPGQPKANPKGKPALANANAHTAHIQKAIAARAQGLTKALNVDPNTDPQLAGKLRDLGKAKNRKEYMQKLGEIEQLVKNDPPRLKLVQAEKAAATPALLKVRMGHCATHYKNFKQFQKDSHDYYQDLVTTGVDEQAEVEEHDEHKAAKYPLPKLSKLMSRLADLDKEQLENNLQDLLDLMSDVREELRDRLREESKEAEKALMDKHQEKADKSFEHIRSLVHDSENPELEKFLNELDALFDLLRD